MQNNMILILVYLIMDVLWLSIMTPKFYKPKFEDVQKSEMKVKYPYVFMAYILLLVCHFLICIPLAIHYKDVSPALVFGMVGLVVYGVYNCTNAAVLTNYDWRVASVDTLWGVSSFAFLGLLWDSYLR